MANDSTSSTAASAEDPPAAQLPLLIGARQAAALCSISLATWFRLRAAGKIGPEPVRLGGRVLWSLAELVEWTAAPRGPSGQLPDRGAWGALQAGKRNGRG
jgi:predicted DNA-binding transcriptional regulator AlpA